MSIIQKDEEIILSIRVNKDIKQFAIIGNIFANLISRGVAGRITNDFILNLTEDNLYIEAMGYSTWGGIPEIMHTEKINRNDIKNFSVENRGDEELITITTNDGQLDFIRSNESRDGLGLAMSRLIMEDKI